MTRRLLHAALLAALLIVVACRPSAVVSDLDATWVLTPPAPAVGQEAVADLTILGATGEPVRGAHLDLEGHMTHPGMAPVVLRLTDTGDGRYRAPVTLTMSGDWVMFISGRLADGRVVRQRVAAVAAAPAE